MLEIEHLLLSLLEHRALLAEFSRDPSVVERNELLLKRPLMVLNDALLAFMQSSYEAAANCGAWERNGLEREVTR